MEKENNPRLQPWVKKLKKQKNRFIYPPLAEVGYL
jgi:hypothetical protein